MEEQNKTMEENNFEKKVSESDDQSAEQSNSSEKDGNNDNFIVALSYLGLLVLIPLLTKKDSEFAQFHIKQGLVLLVIWVVGWIVFWIPFAGWLAMIALCILSIVAFIKTLDGKRWKIPVVGDWAEKINL